MSEFTHLDEMGRLRMVDVGEKPVTRRSATAVCRLEVGPRLFPLLLAGRLPKGDVWAAARLAGIMAAKQTSHLIPLCHPLPLTVIEVEFTPDSGDYSVTVRARVETQAQTGVEMEALTAAAVAALTIYDMCKAVDRGLVIKELLLLEKSGGASGDWRRPQASPEIPSQLGQTGVK
jgi:cyclic pyranopterin phosphate synthase